MPATQSAVQASEPVLRRDWAPGAIIAIAMGALYLAVRPPLFDADGYLYRLWILGPDPLKNMDHLHVLWEPLQILLLSIARSLGAPTAVPFQIFGILVDCLTLFIFWALLREVSESRLFASAATIFVAFSPQFWYLGFQNEPYPLLFLAVVLSLALWNTADRNPPSGLRLIAASLCLAVAVLVHQAAVFLVPAGVLALMIFGPESVRSRVVRAILWGASIAAIVLPVYLLVWAITITDAPFTRWMVGAFEDQHSLQFKFPSTPVQAVIGAVAAIVPSGDLQSFLGGKLSAQAIFALYGVIGIAICAGLAALVWWSRSTDQLVALARTNALFALSLLSIVFWSAIVIVWEPVTPNYWVLDFFPALVCLGFVFRARAWRGLTAFAATALVLSGVNGYLNHAADLYGSRNTPERLIASINQNLGKRDIFIVLANKDWYGDTEYELLFQCLAQNADTRGTAILNDFVLPANSSPSWRDQLAHKIASTMDSGGQVYVAEHLFEPDSYSDLAGIKEPFSPCVNREYLGIDGPGLLRQVKQAFAPYNLEDSDFKIGDDDYFVLQRK